MKPRILIIGATSAIAQSVAKRYAQQQADLFLVARNEKQLAIVTDDLMVRGAARVGYAIWDAHETSAQSAMLASAHDFLGGFDVVLVAYGSLPDQQACEQDVTHTLTEFNTNGLSVIALLTVVANQMLKQNRGTIAVISSVAGDRGRQSNYVYGAAKAAVSVFLQGLRARLFKHNIHVLTIKPGFVATPMTAHLKQNALFVSPDKVAGEIMKAIDKKRHQLYTPIFWLPIMLLVKALPERIAKRLSF